jgi:hypothetical protein
MDGHILYVAFGEIIPLNEPGDSEAKGAVIYSLRLGRGLGFRLGAFGLCSGSSVACVFADSLRAGMSLAISGRGEAVLASKVDVQAVVIPPALQALDLAVSVFVSS